jgi:ankyrin repeat protein
MAAYNEPPLISAVLASNIVECRRLIDTGEANVNEDRDQYGWTALHHASDKGYLEISELLTSSGADVNIRDRYGSTALHLASINDHLEIVQLLLCQGADMSIRNNFGSTALDWASLYGHFKVADCIRKWPWTMAIIALEEGLTVYHLLDASTLIDLWQY